MFRPYALSPSGGASGATKAVREPHEHEEEEQGGEQPAPVRRGGWRAREEDQGKHIHATHEAPTERARARPRGEEPEEGEEQRADHHREDLEPRPDDGAEEAGELGRAGSRMGFDF